MMNEKFRDVLNHEGVVTLVTNGSEGVHLVNTWNSFIILTEDGKLLIPAYAMRRTEKNILAGSEIHFSLGTKEVEGYNAYQGTGFVGKGTGRFLSEGTTFDLMKDKFSFLTRVLEITPLDCKQMI